MGQNNRVSPICPLFQLRKLQQEASIQLPFTLKRMILTLEWTSEGVRFIDQTKLPLEETYVLATSYQQVADVIVTMVVRGAPAIGVSAAMGIALGAKQTKAATVDEFAPEFGQICAVLAGTRPTAVNLFWAID